MKFTLGFFHLAVVQQPGLFDEQPSVESGMLAFGRDLLALEVGNLVDTGVGAHDETVIQQADGLAEINPAIPRGSPDVGRQMIAADKLHAAVGDVLVRIFRSDLVVVVHIQAVLLP